MEPSGPPKRLVGVTAARREPGRPTSLTSMRPRGAVIAIVTLVACAGAVYSCSSLGFGGPGVDGPVIHSGFSFGGDGDDAEVTGALSLDGPCLYIEHPDLPEIRYPVVWPKGTGWQAEPAGVTLPGGAVALLGQVVYGGGGYYKERDRIESVAGLEGADLALRCAEEPYHEVAIFNPGSRVDTLE